MDRVRKRRRWIFAGLVSLPLLGYGILCFVIAYHLVYPTRKVTPPPPTGWNEVMVETAVGRMPTWENPHALKAPRVVILLHGRNGTREQMQILGEELTRRGYGVAVPALRGQAEGPGNGVTFGFGEADDVHAYIADLQARRRTPAELGLFGASLGGTTAIFAAAQDPERFEVVMAESAFVRLDWAAEDRMPPILRPGVIFLGERLAGRSSASINCEQQVCALKGRRVLLFHSKGDRTVWERHADRFEELLGVEVERMEGPHARLTHTRADYFADRFDEQWPATHAEEQSARASAN